MRSLIKKSTFLLIVLSVTLLSTVSYSQYDDVYYRGNKAYNTSRAEKGRGNVNVSLFSHYTNAKEAEDKSVLAGARITYDVFTNLEIGVEGGWQQWDIVDEDDIKYGKLHDFPVLGLVIFKYPIEINATQKFVPYILGGAGATFWDFDKESFIIGSIENDPTFTAKAGGGFDFYFLPYSAIFLEGGYVWRDYNVKAFGPGGMASETFDMKYWYAGGGLKFSI